MSEGKLPYRLEKFEGYSVFVLEARLKDCEWHAIEQTGAQVISELETIEPPILLIDLTELDYMGSSAVALLVRIWKLIKGRDGKVAVVNRNNVIQDMLKIAGLTKLWDVVPRREEAMHLLGVSEQAKITKRETRLLTIVGPMALLAAGAGLAAWYWRPDSLPLWSFWALIAGAGGLAIVAGFINICRAAPARGIAVVIFLISVAVVGTGVTALPKKFKEPPPPNVDPNGRTLSPRESKSTNDPPPAVAEHVEPTREDK